MPIINRSSSRHGGGQTALFDGALALGGDWLAEARDPAVNDDFNGAIGLGGDWAAIVADPNVADEFQGTVNLAGDWLAAAVTPGSDVFDGVIGLAGDWAFETALVLVAPEPLLRTVAANAFSNQDYRGGGGRLLVNDIETKFVRAEINAPAGTLGKTLSIELAQADLSLLPANAAFRFEIGKRVAGALQWTTIVDGARLTSRQFRMSSGRNGLSISIKDFSSKLDKFPKNNLIVYDAAKADVSIDDIEPLYANTDEAITTAAVPITVLTLYKLLDIAFVDGCGFSSVETDIPNYEIARCDFSVTNSYASAVAQFIGMYEPDFRVEGNSLLIQKTIDPHPTGYAPNSIQANRYPNFTEAQDFAAANMDGYIVSYMASAGATFVDRNLPDVIEPSGTFGAANFTETTIRRKMRDWFEPGEPVAVRSELKKETREIRRNGIIIGRETKENLFDRLGRASGYTNTIEARMPDVMQNDAPTLLLARSESQKIRYKTNPFSPRQTIPGKIETASKALLAVDSENTALDANGDDAPYGQDYERVFEAGNLKSGMTSEFRTLETVTEYFRPQPNGQIEVRVERFDALRGKMKPSLPSDVRSGDISVLNFQRQKQRVIFRAGVTQANRTGEMRALNAGELPYLFASEIAEYLLEQPPVTGQVELIGFDESLERGVSFNLRGRNDENLGDFKARGYTVVIEPDSIRTNVEALKVS